MEDGAMFSGQSGDGPGAVQLMGPAVRVVPVGFARNAEGRVEGGGKVLRSLPVGGRLRAEPVRGADDASALDAAAGEEKAHHRTPVVPPGIRVDARRAPEFTR